jgi:hypothetical protein
MRMGPITGSIGESWPLFVPLEDDPVSCPLDDSEGIKGVNFLALGVTTGCALVYPCDAPCARRTIAYRVPVRWRESPPWV